MIDTNGEVIETDEGNNTAVHATQITVADRTQKMTLFDITFEEAKHVIGQAPATGSFDSPTDIPEGSPEVVNFGGSKALKFNAPVNPLGDASRETIRLAVAKESGNYVLEYDLHPETLVLPPSGGAVKMIRSDEFTTPKLSYLGTSKADSK